MESSRTGSADQVTVNPVQLEEVDQSRSSGRPATGAGLELVEDVRVRLTMSVGAAEMSIGELYGLKEGEVVKLDKLTNEPIDIFLDDKLVARGELMVSGEHFAIRITEIGAKN